MLNHDFKQQKITMLKMVTSTLNNNFCLMLTINYQLLMFQTPELPFNPFSPICTEGY